MNRIAILAVILWAAVAARVLVDPHTEPEPLRREFSALPMEILGERWTGRNVVLDEEVVRKAGVSSYVNRVYTNGSRRVWFYVGYVSGGTPESIHYPEICFPSNGRQLAAKSDVDIAAPGLDRKVHFRELLWQTLTGPLFTLTSVYCDGKFETNPENLRWGRWRGMRYFAIITLSGDLVGTPEESREAYSEMLRRALPTLLEHLPAS
jgi:hypothetical protein